MLRLILGMALLAAAVQAQTRDLRLENVSEFQKSTKVALVIGVGAYPEDSGLSALKYPVHDAEALATELQHQGYAVHKLLDSNATRPIVRKLLNELGQVIDPNQGSFLFYFAGHGYAQDGVNYLATFGVAADDLKSDGLAIPDVEAMLKTSRARRQMLIVDACRSEPRRGSRDAVSRTFSDLTASEGMRALYATRAGAVSYESDELQHGVFTHFLIEGLSGGAANPQDGLVTFRDLSDYVIAKVKSYSVKSGKVQVPFEAGESSGDFLVGRALGGHMPFPITKRPENEAPASAVPLASASLPGTENHAQQTAPVTVVVPVQVVDDRGNSIPNIPKEVFLIKEDNVIQPITDYSMADGLYLISYHPIGHGRDGKLHSIQVGLISPKDGRALLMKNERGTPIRYRIAASNRYVSAQEVEKLPAPSVLPKSSR